MNANQKWGWALVIVGIIGVFAMPGPGYFMVALSVIVIVGGAYLLIYRMIEGPDKKTYDQWEKESRKGE